MNPVDSAKVTVAMDMMTQRLARIPLNDYERIVVLQNMLSNEKHVLEAKNLATAMFQALNPRG